MARSPLYVRHIAFHGESVLKLVRNFFFQIKLRTQFKTMPPMRAAGSAIARLGKRLPIHRHAPSLAAKVRHPEIINATAPKDPNWDFHFDFPADR
jgi:hypothetical protein